MREQNIREGIQKNILSKCLGDIKKCNFLYYCIELWNNLSEEVIVVVNVSKFKEKLDNCSLKT